MRREVLTQGSWFLSVILIALKCKCRMVALKERNAPEKVQVQELSQLKNQFTTSQAFAQELQQICMCFYTNSWTRSFVSWPGKVVSENQDGIADNWG